MLIFIGAAACTAPKFCNFTEANMCVLSLVQCAAQHRHQTILMCAVMARNFWKIFFRAKIFSPLQELEAALLPQLGNLSQLELVRDSPGRWRLHSEWSDPVLHQTPCLEGGRGEAGLLSSCPPGLQCQYIQHFRQRSLGWRHHLRGGQYSSPLTRTLYFR